MGTLKTTITFAETLSKSMKKEHILNVSAVEGKMKDRPKGQRLYLFLNQGMDVLEASEIKEIMDVVKRESKKTIESLNKKYRNALKHKPA